MRYREIINETSIESLSTSWFRSWFGDSTVVDANGQPLVVYHGTSNPRFNKFKFKGGMGGALGFWFASTKQAAGQFAHARFAGVKPGIKLCVLKISNPQEYNGYTDFVDAVKARMKGGEIEQGMKSLRRSLIRSGHDGIVIRNSDSDSGGIRDDWVTFEPKQIMVLDSDDQEMNEAIGENRGNNN